MSLCRESGAAGIGGVTLEPASLGKTIKASLSLVYPWLTPSSRRRGSWSSGPWTRAGSGDEASRGQPTAATSGSVGALRRPCEGSPAVALSVHARWHRQKYCGVGGAERCRLLWARRFRGHFLWSGLPAALHCCNSHACMLYLACIICCCCSPRLDHCTSCSDHTW